MRHTKSHQPGQIVHRPKPPWDDVVYHKAQPRRQELASVLADIAIPRQDRRPHLRPVLPTPAFSRVLASPALPPVMLRPHKEPITQTETMQPLAYCSLRSSQSLSHIFKRDLPVQLQQQGVLLRRERSSPANLLLPATASQQIRPTTARAKGPANPHRHLTKWQGGVAQQNQLRLCPGTVDFRALNTAGLPMPGNGLHGTTCPLRHLGQAQRRVPQQAELSFSPPPGHQLSPAGSPAGSGTRPPGPAPACRRPAGHTWPSPGSAAELPSRSPRPARACS
jgi:hypothetical protein